MDNIKYHILFRACDKVESCHNTKRPFNLNKRDTIKICFFSLYQSLQNEEYKITIIGDDLSEDLLKFFDLFKKNVYVNNFKLGSAKKSLIKQMEIASDIEDDFWIYLCEDDYLHQIHSFTYISDLIKNKKDILKTSGEKKNYLNSIIGDLSNVPIVIHPPDYPDRYLPYFKNQSYIFKSNYCHWRQIINTTHTFLINSSDFKKFGYIIKESAVRLSDSYLSKNLYASYSFYNSVLCLSPIPSLSTHMTIGVMSPFVNWEQIYKEYLNELNEFINNIKK